MEQLLSTKLYIPSLRSYLISRPRLTERLLAASQSKLILVCAPAGYGKTTLVIEWLKESEYLRTWLSLDESDNDPRRFLVYLIAALRQVDPGIGRAAEAMSRSPQPPPDEVLITALVNEIAAVPEPFFLVLDDYHFIQAPSIHQQIAALLEHQPPQMHLVLITRQDPLLPLARLRSRGQMLEIRQEDLRFTPDETASFLKRMMGLVLSADDLAALERRTGGLIAGLHLAALSMQGRADLKGFVQDFIGSSRFILDYLIEEVYERQTPEVRDFLLKTSILDRLHGPLCDALTGKSSGQETLEMLEQANLFIVPLDQSRNWYRYHRLFAELLRDRLRASIPGDEIQLHTRASRWFERQGLRAEAVGHALDAGDWERGAGLIVQASDDLLKRGQMGTLLGWIQRVPEELVRSRPDLGMSYAWALLLSGRLDEAEESLRELEEFGTAAPDLMGQVTAAQAYAARARGDDRRVIEKSELALELLPEGDIAARGLLSLNLGLVYWSDGRLREALSALKDARALSLKVENHFAALTTQIYLARTLASQGARRPAGCASEPVFWLGGIQERARNPRSALGLAAALHWGLHDLCLCGHDHLRTLEAAALKWINFGQASLQGTCPNLYSGVSYATSGNPARRSPGQEMVGLAGGCHHPVHSGEPDVVERGNPGSGRLVRSDPQAARPGCQACVSEQC